MVADLDELFEPDVVGFDAVLDVEGLFEVVLCNPLYNVLWRCIGACGVSVVHSLDQDDRRRRILARCHS